jgi:hypothetical protein
MSKKAKTTVVGCFFVIAVMSADPSDKAEAVHPSFFVGAVPTGGKPCQKI